jgi:hypothetical protein
MGPVPDVEGLSPGVKGLCPMRGSASGGGPVPRVRGLSSARGLSPVKGLFSYAYT